MKLSVVIPTLGGIQLTETIKRLHNSSIRPLEILICIPSSSELLADIKLFNNIQIIRTLKKGQVYQRSIGFKIAKGDYVLQLDDDVYLEKDSIRKLINCINSSNEKKAIAPNYRWLGTDTSVFESKRSKLSNWIMNGFDGYKPGTISKVGIGFGLNFGSKFKEENKSEWLPGGCIMHRADNLIIKDYFPFSGKAYSEDLIHSFLLEKNGVKLYVCKNAIAYIEPIFYSDSLEELNKQYKVTKYFVYLSGRGQLRLKIYYFLRFIQKSLKAVTKKVFGVKKFYKKN